MLNYDLKIEVKLVGTMIHLYNGSATTKLDISASVNVFRYYICKNLEN